MKTAIKDHQKGFFTGFISTLMSILPANLIILSATCLPAWTVNMDHPDQLSSPYPTVYHILSHTFIGAHDSRQFEVFIEGEFWGGDL